MPSRPKNETPVPVINEKLVFSEQEINDWICNMTGDKINSLNVALQDDNQIDLSFILDDKIYDLVNLENSSSIGRTLNLLKGQELSCRLEITKEMELMIHQCKVGSFMVPQTMYQNAIDRLNSELQGLNVELGIEGIAVFGEKIEIQGDISKVLQMIGKK